MVSCLPRALRPHTPSFQLRASKAYGYACADIVILFAEEHRPPFPLKI
jgi:hypothetical protein